MKKLKPSLFETLCWLTLLATFALPMAILHKHDYGAFHGTREIANKELECIELVDTIINQRKIVPDPAEVKISKEVFWKKHGAIYLHGKLDKKLKYVFKKIKVFFMNLNKSERPILYIENDENSYAKIFNYVEDMSATKEELEGNKGATALKEEVENWLKTYSNYVSDMDSFVDEFAMNASTIKEILKLKNESNLKFPIRVVYNKYGADRKVVEFIDDINTEEEFDEILIRLRGKNQKIRGGIISGQGLVDSRDYEQGLLYQRLMYLEREIRDLVANTPDLKEQFGDISKRLRSLLSNPDLRPSIRIETLIELKEMNAEFKAAFKKAKLKTEGLEGIQKTIIENLSDRHKKKLGLDDERKWANVLSGGRWGLILSAGGGGGYVTIMQIVHFFGYDQDKKFDITNAKDDSAFTDSLNEYLRSEYPIELTSRIELNDQKEIVLKGFNPKNKKEVDFLNTVREIVKLRKQYIKESKELEAAQEKFTEAIENVQVATTTEEAKQAAKVEAQLEKVRHEGSSKRENRPKVDGKKKGAKEKEKVEEEVEEVDEAEENTSKN